MTRPASYVLPLRWTSEDQSREELPELTDYLRLLAGLVEEVVVVDGSPPELYERHARAWSPYVRHLRPDPRLGFANGKVNGVVTGIAAARHERVVLADDDVRHDGPGLDRVLALLAAAEIVRPQNYFSPLPWHARWDTARSLLNRAWTADYPGTFGLRRSAFLRAGGYDGDVLFENLEMVRTLKAHGAREVRPLDLYVLRRPPEPARFWDQRPRQAYDDFAQPGRLAVWLSALPIVAALARRRPRRLLAGAAAVVGLAEVGRRRGDGRSVYPPDVPAYAPLWVLERAVFAWYAVAQRLRFGGVVYAGRRLGLAAHSERELRRRARAGSVAVDWLVAHLSPEADGRVRAVTEGLERGGPAAAQGDGAPARVDLRPVRGDQPERAAHQQRPVRVRGDGGTLVGASRLGLLPRLLRVPLLDDGLHDHARAR